MQFASTSALDVSIPKLTLPNPTTLSGFFYKIKITALILLFIVSYQPLQQNLLQTLDPNLFLPFCR